MRIPHTAIALLFSFGAFPALNDRAHDLHLTYSRVVVDGTSIQCRVRVFKDDMEKGLQGFAKSPALRVTASPSVDSLFAAYFNAYTTFVAGGERLRGRVIQSGLDADATDPQMWWFLVELPAAKPVRSLSIRMSLLFEAFNDQKNVVTLLKMPGEERHSLYFAGAAAKDQLFEWKEK